MISRYPPVTIKLFDTKIVLDQILEKKEETYVVANSCYNIYVYMLIPHQKLKPT